MKKMKKTENDKSLKKALPVKKNFKKEVPQKKIVLKQKSVMKKDLGERKGDRARLVGTVKGQHHEIIQMLVDDHKPLKRLIDKMKDSEASMSVRRSAFNEFVPLLTIHARSEENSLYNFEKSEIDMREEAFEGYVEHLVADQLIEEIKKTADKDLWGAQVKVLAELVEHHIEEEESEIFPEFKKCTTLEDRIRLGEEYQVGKSKIKGDVLHPQIRIEETTFVASH